MQNEFKGTPGPWVPHYQNGTCVGVATQDKFFKKLLVSSTFSEELEKSEAKKKENEANVVLMATALELLEALQELAVCFERQVTEFDLKDFPEYNYALAVIKKALT